MAVEEPSLAAQYAAESESMHALRDGHALRVAAAQVARRLPAGRLALLATSPEGAALAAVCAASRDAPCSWQLIHLMYPPTVSPGDRVVVVEPIDPGDGWREAVSRHYPDALLVFASAVATRVTAVAA
jgi:hypothetical protein